MNVLARGGVEFAVGDAGPRAHALDFPGPDHGAGPQIVSMLERALEHVTDDLHVSVPVGRKPTTGLNTVLVDDAERAEPHLVRVAILPEGKRVTGVEPAEIEVPAGVRARQP